MRTISVQTTSQNVHWFLKFQHFLSRAKQLTRFTEHAHCIDHSLVRDLRFVFCICAKHFKTGL